MWKNIDYHLLCMIKRLNSKCILIMLTLNKMWVREVLLMVMVALTWSGYISLSCHDISIINGKHNAECLAEHKL